MIADNLKELFEVLKKKHVLIAEAAIIIVRQMSSKYEMSTVYQGPMNEPIPTVWERLPDYALQEVKDWFINNWFRIYSILEPENHAQIMAMSGPQAQFYRDWFNSSGEKGRAMMASTPNVQWYSKD